MLTASTIGSARENPGGPQNGQCRASQHGCGEGDGWPGRLADLDQTGLGLHNGKSGSRESLQQRLGGRAPDVVQHLKSSVLSVTRKGRSQLRGRLSEPDGRIRPQLAQPARHLRVASGSSTTGRAPNSFAICTASWPATPVAPRIRTVSPGKSRAARCVSESQADMPGLGRAAATKVSRPSGNVMHRAWSTTVRSAIAP